MSDPIEEVLTVGAMMSNLCFNIGQEHSDGQLGAGAQAGAKRLQERWDEAVRAYRDDERAKSPQTSDEGGEETPQVTRSAYLCLKNGWDVGTRLEGTEYNGVKLVSTRIELRYIGERMIVAKTIAVNRASVDGRETSWDLTCRDWDQVG